MSGAGEIKGDGSTSEKLYEVKDAKKTYTINLSEMKAHHLDASMRGKEAILVVEFPEYTMEATITYKGKQK